MLFSRFLGYSDITTYHNPTPVKFETYEGQTINVLKLVELVTPPCRLSSLLFNGHLQTFWTAFQTRDVPIYYKRRIFEAEEAIYAGTFAVDFPVAPNDSNDDSLPPRTSYFEDSDTGSLAESDIKPMLVILHGLSGGSHEIYVREALQPILAAGWEACVVNSRGCAESKVTTGVLYNARATWDLRQVVKWLRLSFPNRPLYGLGFSLGANIMVNVRTKIRKPHAKDDDDRY